MSLDVQPATYKQAGVSLDAAEMIVERIAKATESTRRTGVLGSLGGFAGCFALASGAYDEPVLVSSTDGVGTKLLVAEAASCFGSIGIDLVAMCVDDLVCTGAEPLFLLDYLAMSRLDADIVEEIVSGIAQGCRLAGCSLIGGETAEHGTGSANSAGGVGADGSSADGSAADAASGGDGAGPVGNGQCRVIDLAGFAVGVVELDRMLGSHNVVSGDVLIGLRSPGLRSNGYSLARHVLLGKAGMSLDDAVWEGADRSVGQELLLPSVIYTPMVRSALKTKGIHAVAHITGGGIPGNLKRSLSPDCDGIVNMSLWDRPRIFYEIQRLGNVDSEEMLKVFNLGIGMIVIASSGERDRVLDALNEAGADARVVGRVKEGSGKVIIEGMDA
ncbi:MAG: phosphoribosylformylglycinamidine cyclo-ligase [Acidimicrobiales bacterium]